MFSFKKQPPRGVLSKGRSKNMQRNWLIQEQLRDVNNGFIYKEIEQNEPNKSVSWRTR